MRIYYVHPLMVGPIGRWPAHLSRCRAMGFDHIATAPIFAPGSFGDIFLTGDHEAIHPALRATGPADRVVGELCEMCRSFGLDLIIDIVVDRVAADSHLASGAPQWFRPANLTQPAPIDPRAPPLPAAVSARFDEPEAAKGLAHWWSDRLARLVRAGVAGFRCYKPDRVPSSAWRHIISGTRQASPACHFLAWTPGMQWSQISALRGTGFDAVFSSLPWWDGRASWFIHERELLRQLGRVLAAPESPFGTRLARRLGSPPELCNAYRHALLLAAALGDGLLIPMGFEFASAQEMDRRHCDEQDFGAAEQARAIDLSNDIHAANLLNARLAELGMHGETRALTGPQSAATAVLRADHNDVRRARSAIVILINPDLAREQGLPVSLDPLPPAAGASFVHPAAIQDRNPDSPLAPGEVRVVRVERNDPIRQRRRDVGVRKLALASPRIVIENIAPAVDAGSFAAKRVIGESLNVEADVFTDGHDVLAVELVWRGIDEQEWRRARMQPLGNDRWQAVLRPRRIGRHLYSIESWWDGYATFCRDLELKQKAGADVKLEVEEGRRLLDDAHKRAQGCAKQVIETALAALRKPCSNSNDMNIFFAADLRDAMAACDERPFRYQHQPALPLEIERPQAGFGSWYELFPRSATDDPVRHGTFDGVIARLAAIRDMGFDVLYLPPIHPIGTTNRKGRNNALRAEPNDVGSAYAIGGSEGGHDAIHPALGTIDDFRRLRDAAIAHGLELALDFAIQCSPDHPWLKQHPGWFRWRPDGSVRFAENPPKKYEDIVNADFYAEDALPDLWTALRDVLLYWVHEGVLIFRVDNPHTKPLPFWEWVIADVRARHPEVIFLSEAFTRPKMMYRLAKVGFSQSYTYFTWRNSKQELTDYLTELTTSDVKEYFRPHFFVNTPDINPFFLQTSGRPGFLIRAALAATLSGLWGMYSGFELCESAPLPGREEYLDSEKYQIRVRDYDAPGNITAEIAQLNRIRRANPALQSHLGLRFYNAFNDQVIYYGKSSATRDAMILVAVSLDPHRVQEATIEVPLWEWGLPDGDAVLVDDLMRDARFVWSGKLQRIRLDPADLPFAIWRIAPARGG